MASIYFISLVAYGMNPVLTVVGTFIFPVQHMGVGRNVALMATFLLSVTDNFDEELMMDYGLDELPSFMRKEISSSAKSLQKSSTYNNLVALVAMVVCNYNETSEF